MAGLVPEWDSRRRPSVFLELGSKKEKDWIARVQSAEHHWFKCRWHKPISASARTQREDSRIGVFFSPLSFWW
ncbi:unnamed protein product [Allacma fusca]|uniref:Uncharacterized protein n=1 Tax=Allacma fusca TaxID=39272 RepID=A0A8J2PCR1_9HEXA|nr:unnamed protein product [Allacma fusca]